MCFGLKQQNGEKQQSGEKHQIGEKQQNGQRHQKRQKQSGRYEELMRCPADIRKWILAVYCLSGFTGMAFQVYQTRLLTLFFMDSVYDFAIILAVYLAGSCLGNLVSAFWAERTGKPMRFFAGSQVVLGICSLISLYTVSQLPFGQRMSGLRARCMNCMVRTASGWG